MNPIDGGDEKAKRLEIISCQFYGAFRTFSLSQSYSYSFRVDHKSQQTAA